MYRYLKIIVLFALMTTAALAGVPQELNHQGKVSVSGVPFDGTGLFRFAIVDLDTGQNLWTNDDTNVGAIGTPTNAVSLPVVSGLYNVRLGNTNLANMGPIAPSVFAKDNTSLRIWFDDGVHGAEQLLPDHKISSSPYSFRLSGITSDALGNIGIGTTNPTVPLHVAADGGEMLILETTMPSPLTGIGLSFARMGSIQKSISLAGINDLQFFQGTGANDSVANRVFMTLKENSGYTVFHSHVGIVSPPVGNAILNVGTESFTSSIRVNANTSSGSTPLVDIVSTVHASSDILFNITGDSDTDAGGPWTAFMVRADGSILGRSGLLHSPSDRRLKRDIVTVPNALERVLALRGVNFKWKDTHLDGDSMQIGMIAQEVEKVFPEAVQTSKDKMGTKAVEYEHLIGALVEAIKELDGIVKQKDSEQATLIAKFESRMAALEARLSKKVAQVDRSN